MSKTMVITRGRGLGFCWWHLSGAGQGGWWEVKNKDDDGTVALQKMKRKRRGVYGFCWMFVWTEKEKRREISVGSVDG